MTDALFHPEGARLGTSAAALRNPWVLVLDGVVAHCGPRPPDGTPEGIDRIEGGWLTEPLADAHVHLFLPGTFDGGERKAVAGASREAALARILDILVLCRRFGIVAVRDGGDPRGLALEIAQLVNSRQDRYAAVLPAGEPIFRRGQYGGFLGRGVESSREARGLATHNHEAGARHAKLLATGLNSLEEPGRAAQSQFTPTEFVEIRAAADDLGVPLMVHANGSLGSLRRILGSPTTLEHGFWLAEGDEKAIADMGTVWVPTIGAWAALGEHPELSNPRRAVVAITDERHREQVARGSDFGVLVAAGSDAGSPGVEHGIGLLNEMRCLAAAGLGAQGALAAAFRSRRLCEDEAGRQFGGLRVGGPAGFMLVPEDPASRLDTLQDPLGIWLGGQWTPRGPTAEREE